MPQSRIIPDRGSQPPATQPPAGWFVLAAGVSLTAYLGIAAGDWGFGSLRGPRTPATIVWFLVAFGVYIFAIRMVENRGVAVKWVWIAAAAFRLVLLMTTPTLSDDVYRYLWDGHVAINGVSPYAHAIEDPLLNPLDHPVRSLANNTWMASPYMPAAQLIFSLNALIFPLEPFFIQLLMTAFDLMSAWFIARLLALAALPASRILLYLWNPLVIVEVAQGGHIDAWMIFLTLAAVYLSFAAISRHEDSKRQESLHQETLHQETLLSDGLHDSNLKSVGGPAVLALATLTKLLPALIFPVLFWRWSWKQRLLYGGLAAGLLLPFGWRVGWGVSGELSGTGLFGALRIYSAQWKFNSGVFFWLEQWLHSHAADPVSVAKVIAAAAFLLLMGWTWLAARLRQTPRRLIRLMSLPLMGYLLLTPTVHPWYALFLLAFVPFLPPAAVENSRRWWLAAPWIYLSGALIFSYLTYLDPQNFAEPPWVRGLEWLPTLGLLLVGTILNAPNDWKSRFNAIAFRYNELK